MADPVIVIDASGSGGAPEVRPPTEEEQAAMDVVAATALEQQREMDAAHAARVAHAAALEAAADSGDLEELGRLIAASIRNGWAGP